MQKEYTVRYTSRKRWIRALGELQRSLDITWAEERTYMGCTSLESVFTIEMNDANVRTVERRLLLGVPVMGVVS